ncbi:MAG TPA: acetylxylan esterase [Phycisphaerae bacterium]|nr:acetylxylan esterase [Phycisphaerae bacterium]
MKITHLLVSIFLLPLAARAAGDPPAISPADRRADFLKLIDRPRVPLKSEAPTVDVQDDAIVVHFAYDSDAHNRVPGILLAPGIAAADVAHIPQRPVVILLHGTNGRKEDMLPLARTLVARGFVAVAIDGPYHGQRTKAGAAGQSTKNTPDYQDAILNAYRTGNGGGGHPFFFDTVWDIMRLIDYLDTRTDVDPHRIGIYGVSKGGIEAYLAAAVDPRIQVAVPCIALESFQWADEHDSWHSRIGTIQRAFDSAAKDAGIAQPDSAFVHQFYAKVAPDIDGEFDGPAMVPLIAPRPLLSINGDSDPRTPQPGLKLAADAVQAAYHADHADDRFQLLLEKNTAHRVTPDAQAAAVDWFVKWLKP